MSWNKSHLLKNLPMAQPEMVYDYAEFSLDLHKWLYSVKVSKKYKKCIYKNAMNVILDPRKAFRV